MSTPPWQPASAGAAAPRRRRQSLARQVSLVTTAVVAIAVVLVGVLGAVGDRSVQKQAKRTALAQRADRFAAALVAGRDSPAVQTLKTEATGLSIRVAYVGPTGVLGTDALARAVVRPADLATLNAGSAFSDIRYVVGREVFLEGRPTATGGVILVQPTRLAADPRQRPLRSTLLPLLIGLGIAVAAGIFLARRITQPLQVVASTAHQMAAGRRDVRVEPSGSQEVAEVADALNGLADALTVSEARQREFLLSVSHELRTPLTALRGFAEALADGVSGPEDAQATGAVMLAESQRLTRLVSDLLDLARLGAQDFRLDLATVDLTTLVTGAADVWAARCAAEGVLFSLEAPAGPLPAHTDPTRVRQIIDGLAENALRVTPAGRPIVLAAYASGGWCVVEVRDGGPGLTDDDLAVAFDRSELYNRYRGIRQVGTGLGLALVGGLATRLGGGARAMTAPEGGARFSVWLPSA